MNKTFLCFLFIFVFLPFSQIYADSIEYFDVYIKLHSDNSADITETIKYDFGDSLRHGIYRYIPNDFRAEGNLVPVDITVESVKDENGIPYKFANEDLFGVNLKIGDPEKYAESFETYVIKYKVDNLVGFFENNDELYWNLTGNEWDVDSIDNVHARIAFPWSVEDKLDSYHYCGDLGSTDSCGYFFVNGNVVFFDGYERLDRGKGVTIDLEFSKGIIHEPTTLDHILDLIRKYYFVFVAFVLAILLFRKIFGFRIKTSKSYREFKRNHPDMVQYDPGKFSLIEASFFHDGRTSLSEDLSGFIVWAAVNRYIKIIEDKGNYFFEKLDKFDSLGSGPERNLLEKIVEIKITKLLYKNIIVDKDKKGSSYFDKSTISIVKDFNKLTDELFNIYAEKVMDNGYILDKEIDKIRKKISQVLSFRKKTLSINYFNYLTFNKFTISLVLMFVSLNPVGFLLVLSPVFGSLVYIPSLTIFFIAIFIIIFLKKIPAYTEKGMEASWYVNGLYEYINMSEKERINFDNAPEKTPVLFEKLLPYAIVFGLESKWTEEFKNIYQNNNPDWFESDQVGVSPFTHISGLSRALDNSFRSSSTSSHGSSGGGGFSGGGGGGGGGGSW